MAEILFGLGVIKVVTIAYIVVFNPTNSQQSEEHDPNAQYVEFKQPDAHSYHPLDESDRTFDDDDHRLVSTEPLFIQFLYFLLITQLQVIFCRSKWTSVLDMENFHNRWIFTSAISRLIVTSPLMHICRIEKWM